MKKNLNPSVLLIPALGILLVFVLGFTSITGSARSGRNLSEALPQNSPVKETSGNSALIFEENFDDGTAPDFGNEAGEWFIEDGLYKALKGSYRFSTVGNPDWKDYSIEADFINSKDGGILCRAQDHNNCVVLVIRPSHNDIYWKLRKNRGWGAEFGKEILGHQPGENLHVKVDVQGNKFMAFINGEIKTVMENPGFPSGKAGLYLYLQDNQAWDNVIVRGKPDMIASDFFINIPSTATEVAAGETATCMIRLRNRQKISDTFTLDASGLDSSLISLDTSHKLLAGEEAEIPLKVTVPEDAAGHTYRVIVQATSNKTGITREAAKQVAVLQEPQIRHLSPQNNARLGSGDVLFSWKTTSKGKGELFLKAEDETDYTVLKGDDGKSHKILTKNLRPDTAYQYYVRTQFGRKTITSDIRKIFIDSGIIFDKRSYSFDIQRDYDQQVSIAVKNMAGEPRELLLSVSFPPEDLAVGFVGAGSMDQTIALRPKEIKHVSLAVHSQDAASEDYSLLLHLSSKGDEDIQDYAGLNLHVCFPKIKYTLEETGSDPHTLAKTIKIVNLGDAVTDFTIEPDDNLKPVVCFSPSIRHTNLRKNRVMEFQAAPILGKFSEHAPGGKLSGKIFAAGGGTVKELPVTFTMPEGADIYYGDPPSPVISATVERDGDTEYCTNDPEVDEILNNGGEISAEDLTEEQIKTILVTIAEGIATDPDPTSLTGIGISLIKTADVNTCAAMVAYTRLKMTEAMKDADWDKASYYEKIWNDWKMRQHDLEMRQLEDDPIFLIPDGDVDFRSGSGWEPLEPKTIKSGEIRTGQDSRTLMAWGGSWAEMGESGHLKILQSRDNPEFFQEVDIYQGSSLWHITAGDFLAHTPQAEIRFKGADAFRNIDAAFRISVSEDNTVIEVRRGHLDIASKESEDIRSVKKGFKALVKEQNINLEEFELPRRSHIDGIPNLAEAKLILDFSLPWPRHTYREHSIDILVNQNLVGRLTDTIPEGQYTFDVNPDYLHFGDNEASSNTISLRTTHLNGGHYLLSSGMKLLYRLTSLEVPVIASSQNEADEIVRTIKHLNWESADGAVFTNSLILSNPTPSPAENITLEAVIYNAGVPRLENVEVVFMDNDAEAGREHIPAIVTNAAVRFPWKASPGEHRLSVQVNPDKTFEEADYGNNTAEITLIIPGGDTVPPETNEPQPAPDQPTGNTLPIISVGLADQESGINFESVKFLIDGVDVTEKVTKTSTIVWYKPDNPMSDGKHKASFSVEDNDGNTRILDWTFNIDTSIPAGVSEDVAAPSPSEKKGAISIGTIVLFTALIVILLTGGVLLVLRRKKKA
ncbi:MAG: hypothetical protein JXB26_16840 [Candidatus Aminicenantes bacterium]|nr:hypothetical protein [Candidatus Aminicenantes bacterium]